MFKRILVAYDGSKSAEKAFHTALFERRLRGSVAKSVIAHAKCTVLVVR